LAPQLVQPGIRTQNIGQALFSNQGRHLAHCLRIVSFEMKRATAPFLGSDIFDGFGEVPAVTVKVLSVVLALAIGLVQGVSQDDGTVLSCLLAMSPSILDANLDDVRIVGHNIAFRKSDAAIASFHLDAVIGDPKADSEAKSLGEPVGGYGWVRVNKHRDHGAGRHRPIKSHPETLSLTPLANLARSGGYAAPEIVNCR
jgi:hypothetical protein